MHQLTADECRVLGVLVEKAHCTPGQYPMSLNGLLAGCNQRTNRNPVSDFDEERVLDALHLLRQKGLVVIVDMAAGRVLRYKHNTREVLEIGTSELVVLAELLLRGPQTVGELRARAMRMHPLESPEVVTGVLEHMSARDEPLVQRIPPSPGIRAERYAQTLCSDLHPLDAAPIATEGCGEANDPPLAKRVERLEHEVAELQQSVARLVELAAERTAGQGRIEPGPDASKGDN